MAGSPAHGGPAIRGGSAPATTAAAAGRSTGRGGRGRPSLPDRTRPRTGRHRGPRGSALSRPPHSLARRTRSAPAPRTRIGNDGPAARTSSPGQGYRSLRRRSACRRCRHGDEHDGPGERVSAAGERRSGVVWFRARSVAGGCRRPKGDPLDTRAQPRQATTCRAAIAYSPNTATGGVSTMSDRVSRSDADAPGALGDTGTDAFAAFELMRRARLSGERPVAR